MKVLKSPRSYDFLKQIELDDIVDNMNNFQQSMVNEIVPIYKLPNFCWSPATIASGKRPLRRLEG